jgi:hypothetical protein
VETWCKLLHCFSRIRRIVIAFIHWLSIEAPQQQRLKPVRSVPSLKFRFFLPPFWITCPLRGLTLSVWHQGRTSSTVKRWIRHCNTYGETRWFYLQHERRLAKLWLCLSQCD